MALICPQCGWNIEGERNSVALYCGNCETFWEASGGKFVKVNFLVVPGQDEDVMYLPFWKTSASTKGLEINSYADFMRITNQSGAIKKEWKRQEMSFWSPAFNIAPRIFLRLLIKTTIFQKKLKMVEMGAKKGFLPVTLPRTEAIQAMKVTLAGSAVHKKGVFSLLPLTRFKIKDSILVYLPFTRVGIDLLQQHTNICFSKKALDLGRYL